MPDPQAPQLIFQGGSDELRLDPDGRVYRPGDPLPGLSQQRRAALAAAGIRIETRHEEPVLTPDGRPATIAAAEQIDGPAVIAAVEPVTAAPADDEPAAQPAQQPRRAAKGE